MCKLMFRIGLLVILGALFLSPLAFAYTINGDITDWGINLSIDGSGKFNNSWVPSSLTASYAQGNDIGPVSGKPSGGEAFDAETLYFDSDGNYGYFALVTSVDPDGMDVSWPYCYSYDFGPGDLAVKLGVAESTFWETSKADFGIGVRPVGLSGGTGHRVPASWGMVRRNDSGNLKWYHENGYSWSEFDQAYFDATTGTLVGTLTDGVDIVWSQWHSSNDIGVGYDYGTPTTGTWIMEARVPGSYFGSDWYYGQSISVRWQTDCVNDYLELNGTIVPEPGTMLLLGSLATGLFGIAAVRRRR